MAQGRQSQTLVRVSVVMLTKVTSVFGSMGNTSVHRVESTF